ncbi:MAG: tetratricopeptide repeat protein [Candidatus Omnitrophica bacterium]|nr:tetratricopeptide repeat protein [Candidatus Omnitrophota bacterium]MBU4590626.1 tetratricopeptide repeat protein [Candidatus Omnitrophota bacterium]
MFARKCVVLIVLVSVAMFLPATVFADQASKDAILKELNTLIDKDPEILRNIVSRIADDYQRNNDIDSAISIYEKGLKIIPGNEDFLSRLGDLYNQKQDFAKVAEIYKQLAAARPDNIWYFQRVAEAYRNADDKAAAAKVWEDLMKTSNNAEVFMQAANFYSNENEMDKAIEAVKKAAELAPDNTGYLQNLESFYMRAEKFSDAEAVCKKVLASAKDQWMKDWANSELINIYQRQDKLDELATKFEADLVAGPKSLANYKKLADLYQRSDKRDEAAAIYEKAATAGVADRDINNRLLDLYEWTEKFDKAKEQVKKIMAESPEDNYLYERLANIQVRADDKDGAKATWQKLLAKSPNDAGLFSRYGDRLNEWGEVDTAIAQYKKAQSIDDKNYWYTMRVADILMSKERFGEAKKELGVIIAKASDDWMKQDAERKLSEIAARQGQAESEVVAAPEVKEEAKPEPKKKKRRGWFGR